MRSPSAGCHAKAMAVQMSVPMSMRSTCVADSAEGTPRSSAKVGSTCGSFEQSVYMIDFRRFSEQSRPCSMPATTLCRSSSNSTMSAASFATSVPRMPIAMPTSASFRAGASFTPSPVMAVMWPPICWKARTMDRLCIGETRAKTQVYFTQFCQNCCASWEELFASDSASKLSSAGNCSSKAAPVMTRKQRASSSFSTAGITPMRLAMASAVHGWSPVTMTVRAPASAIFSTASVAPAFGGSSSATKPRNTNASMGKLASSAFDPSNLKPGARSRRRSARHSTRLPWLMRRPRLSSAAARSMGGRSHMSMTRSGAPLSTARKPPVESSLAVREPSPLMECTVSIHFATLLKGISKTCGCAPRAALALASPSTFSQPETMATSVGDPMSCPSASTLAVLFSSPRLARWARPSEGDVRLEAGTSTRLPASPACGDAAKSVSVILPDVSVPVLSLQRMPTQPRVSTASIFRTSTCRRAIFCDAIMRHTVTVGNRPSGTCAKNAVAAFSRTSATLRLRGEAMLARSERQPTATAT
mmetsp:Transcript_40785/g.105517  ORF Transcript_40785/g.105517 Transcript_40785/m.105517 type:complete len:531 (-) Transcript_40785:349-1941(-)